MGEGGSERKVKRDREKRGSERRGRRGRENLGVKNVRQGKSIAVVYTLCTY